jgi:5-methylcytosine-specific restriction endonuclease McrA
MARKTLFERCKSTLKSMKARAKKDGCVIAFTAEDLVSRVPEHCVWCKRKITPAILNMDHIVPLSRGGSWELDNLIGVCASCNRRKSILDAHEYRQLLRKLSELSEELGSDFVAKNVLSRMAAGAAFIYR